MYGCFTGTDIEKVSNHLSFMTKCKHSWCFKCNEGLNQNRINRCPICKSHAVKYTRNLSIRNVPTKEHFKQYLKAFHNNVNKLTNKPIVEDISKYDHFNIFIVFRSFLNLFTNRPYSHQFIESMRRRKVSDEIRKLIYGNQKMFQ